MSWLRRSKRPLLLTGFGLAGFAVGGVLLFSVVSFWWTSQPSFCNRCHVMNKYVATWEASSHSEVNCENCHTTPGLFGFLGGKIAGLQVVMNYVRGEFEDYSFNAAVPNASCLQCHEDLLDEVFVDKENDIRVSHFHIVENGGKCMNCHSTVAHGDAVPPGSATFPTMDTCMKCHNDVLAPTRCSLCHATREPEDLPEASSTGAG
jgi:nitrate/TMAO reductase-like tetraheme cytochrome c subunit